MRQSQTLSYRFRTQRTDRIRVDGEEVVSIVELAFVKDAAIEVVVERCRTDVAEVFFVESNEAELRVTRTSPVDQAANAAESTHSVVIGADADVAVECLVTPTKRSVVRLWNGWIVGDTPNAWVGNAGMIVEELLPPTGADRRFRLWCSDGLGNADFDDLVVVVTTGTNLLEDVGDADRVVRYLEAPTVVATARGEEE
jgi:hypothetical protein